MTVAISGERSRALVAELCAKGNLPEEYRSAFRSVPRELFIPDRIWVQRDADEGDLAIDRSVEPAAWLDAVYSDLPIVTQFDDGNTVWPAVGYRPSSSASMPSVVAGMLRAVDVRPGHAVLEIGTGTGYNTALLAEIVGPGGSVTTLEVDSELAAVARARLAPYPNVRVHVADGTIAPATAATVDRVIATAGVNVGRLPYWWVSSTRPGGIVLAPMRADLAPGPLVQFVVGADGVARGHAMAELQVEFMELRSHRVAGARLSESRWDDAAADQSYTTLAPWVPLLADAHRWPIAIAVPSCRYDVWERTDDRPGVAWLRDPVSASWATVVPADDDRYLVRQFGPRRLWTEAETAYRWWRGKGQPPLDAWEWIVAPDRQCVALP